MYELHKQELRTGARVNAAWKVEMNLVMEPTLDIDVWVESWRR